MALKDRIIEIAYKLRDEFTDKTSKITGGIKRVESASDSSTNSVITNNKKLAGSFSKITGFVKSFAGAFSAAFAVSRGIAGFNSFVDNVDRIAKTGQKLNITTEALSELEFVAGRYAITNENLSLGLQRMTRRIAEAAKGTGEAKAAIKELNLNAEQLAKLSPDEQFAAIAEQMSLVADQGERVRLGFKLFDSEGVALINTMQNGAAGVEEMRKQARKFGKTISAETAKEVEQFKDNLQDLETQVDSLGRKIGGPIVEGLNKLLKTGIFPDFGDEAASDRIAEINTEIERLQATIERLNKGDEKFGSFFAGFRDESRQKTVSQIHELVAELVSLQEKPLAAQRTALQQRLALNRLAEGDQKEAAEIEKKIGERKLKNLEESLQQQQAAYRNHLNTVKNLLAQEEAVKKEFADLSKELLSPREGPEKKSDFTPRDVNKKIGDAYIAVANQDYEKAIEIARKAAEILRTMREEGTYARLTLSGLALDLGKVAEQAAKGKTDKALIDADKEKAQVDKINDAIQKLKAGVAQDKVPLELSLDQAKFNNDIAALRARVAAEPIKIVVQVDKQGGTTFTDAQTVVGVGAAIANEALARGSK